MILLMILSLLIFFILILLIYSLSRQLLNQLYRLLGLELLSFFLLPGTIVHELSHMIVAEVLFVKTGKFSFKPEVREDNQVSIGQLEVTATDPLRRTVIGLAPIVVGLALIGFIGYPISSPPRSPFGHLGGVLSLLAFSYLLFAISVTMFSSPKDLEAAAAPALLATILILFFWLAGFKLTVPKNIIDWIGNLLANLNRALLIVVGLDLIALFILKGLNSFIKPH